MMATKECVSRSVEGESRSKRVLERGYDTASSGSSVSLYSYAGPLDCSSANDTPVAVSSADNCEIGRGNHDEERTSSTHIIRFGANIGKQAESITVRSTGLDPPRDIHGFSTIITPSKPHMNAYGRSWIDHVTERSSSLQAKIDEFHRLFDRQPIPSQELDEAKISPPYLLSEPGALHAAAEDVFAAGAWTDASLSSPPHLGRRNDLRRGNLDKHLINSSMEKDRTRSLNRQTVLVKVGSDEESIGSESVFHPPAALQSGDDTLADIRNGTLLQLVIAALSHTLFLRRRTHISGGYDVELGNSHDLDNVQSTVVEDLVAEKRSSTPYRPGIQTESWHEGSLGFLDAIRSLYAYSLTVFSILVSMLAVGLAIGLAVGLIVFTFVSPYKYLTDPYSRREHAAAKHQFPKGTLRSWDRPAPLL